MQLSANRWRGGGRRAGKHAPEPRAEVKGLLSLKQGPHQFEYYHAATGEETCMVAAWQIPGLNLPSKISPNMFQFDRVLRVPPVQLEHRVEGYLPDYRMAILGDIPSPEPDEPALVRTQFVDASPAVLAANAKYAWNFGDGQSSEFASPGHVFLHPGAYRVSLTLKRGSRQPVISNRIYVTRQFIVDAKGQEAEDLTAYLETLEQYNSTNLDATGLVQLVRAYLLADDPVNAAQAAQAAFAPGASGQTDETRWAIARLVGPVLRDRLDNPRAAAQMWTDTTAMTKNTAIRVTAATHAADVYLNDLLLPADAKAALSFVEKHLSEASPITRSRYYRITGDWHARSGNPQESRAAYLKADATRELEFNTIERTAWQGAHSRSTEAFLRSNELLRVKEELDQWQTDFPADKVDGYLPLLQVRYLYALKKYPRALATASDALVVNPRSPYGDRLVFMTAKCEESLGRIPRAIATHQALAADYPGSPLVEISKTEVQRLTGLKK